MQLSRMESAEIIGAIALTNESMWDDLGLSRLFSTVRWSCIGRAKLAVPIIVFAVQ
jgi:hypothetical protein